ncbi:hypothetical protein D3C72_1900290 [compost metagenome]
MFTSVELTNALNRMDPEGFTEDRFEYQFKLNKSGTPSKINFIKLTSSDYINNVIKPLLSNISFYYPSLENGVPVADTLTVTGKIYTNSEGKLTVLPIIIRREKGQ